MKFEEFSTIPAINVNVSTRGQPEATTSSPSEQCVYAKLLLTCGGVPLSGPARSAVAENRDATSNGDS